MNKSKKLYNKNSKKYIKNKNKTRKSLKGSGFWNQIFFPKPCITNSDCQKNQFCDYFSHRSIIPFYGYYHYFINKPGQCMYGFRLND